MKKIFNLSLSLLITVMLCIVPVFASDVTDIPKYVFDHSNVLEDSEIQELESEIVRVRDNFGYDIVVVTIDDLGGKTPQEYADDFYDYNGFADDGLLLLIDYDFRKVTISTAGEVIRIFTDSRVESTIDACIPHMKESNEFAAMTAFLQETERYFKDGITDGQYNYDVETGAVSEYRSISLSQILFCAFASLLIAFIVCACVYGKYQLKSKQYNYPLSQNNKTNLLQKNDTFLRESTSVVKIQRSSSSGSSSGGGGRSSTHTSSSGKSHGGGSKGF